MTLQNHNLESEFLNDKELPLLHAIKLRYSCDTHKVSDMVHLDRLQ